MYNMAHLFRLLFRLFDDESHEIHGLNRPYTFHFEAAVQEACILNSHNANRYYWVDG